MATKMGSPISLGPSRSRRHGFSHNDGLLSPTTSSFSGQDHNDDQYYDFMESGDHYSKNHDDNNSDLNNVFAAAAKAEMPNSHGRSPPALGADKRPPRCDDPARSRSARAEETPALATHDPRTPGHAIHHLHKEPHRQQLQRPIPPPLPRNKMSSHRPEKIPLAIPIQIHRRGSHPTAPAPKHPGVLSPTNPPTHTFTLRLLPSTRIKHLCLQAADYLRLQHNTFADGTRFEARDRGGYVFEGDEAVSELNKGETVFLIENGKKDVEKEGLRSLRVSESRSRSRSRGGARTPSVAASSARKQTGTGGKKTNSEPRTTPSQRALEIAQRTGVPRSEPRGRALATSSRGERRKSVSRVRRKSSPELELQNKREEEEEEEDGNASTELGENIENSPSPKPCDRSRKLDPKFDADASKKSSIPSVGAIASQQSLPSPAVSPSLPPQVETDDGISQLVIPDSQDPPPVPRPSTQQPHFTSTGLPSREDTTMGMYGSKLKERDPSTEQKSKPRAGPSPTTPSGPHRHEDSPRDVHAHDNTPQQHPSLPGVALPEPDPFDLRASVTIQRRPKPRNPFLSCSQGQGGLDLFAPPAPKSTPLKQPRPAPKSLKPDPYDIDAAISDDDEPRQNSVMRSSVRKLGSTNKRVARPPPRSASVPRNSLLISSKKSSAPAPASTDPLATPGVGHVGDDSDIVEDDFDTIIPSTPLPAPTPLVAHGRGEASSPPAPLPSSPTDLVAAVLARDQGNNTWRRRRNDFIVIEESDHDADQADDVLHDARNKFSSPHPGSSSSDAALPWSAPPLRLGKEEDAFWAVRTVGRRTSGLGGNDDQDTIFVKKDAGEKDLKADTRALAKTREVEMAVGSKGGKSKTTAAPPPSTGRSPIATRSPFKIQMKTVPQVTVSPGKLPLVLIHGSSSSEGEGVKEIGWVESAQRPGPVHRDAGSTPLKSLVVHGSSSEGMSDGKKERKGERVGGWVIDDEMPARIFSALPVDVEENLPVIDDPISASPEDDEGDFHVNGPLPATWIDHADTAPADTPPTRWTAINIHKADAIDATSDNEPPTSAQASKRKYDITPSPPQPTESHELEPEPPGPGPPKRKRQPSTSPASENEGRSQKRARDEMGSARRKATQEHWQETNQAHEEAERLRFEEKKALRQRQQEEKQARQEAQRQRRQEERKRLALEQAHMRAKQLEAVVSSPLKASEGVRAPMKIWEDEGELRESLQDEDVHESVEKVDDDSSSSREGDARSSWRELSRRHLNANPQGSQARDTAGKTNAQTVSPNPAPVVQQVIQQDEAVGKDALQAKEPEQLSQRHHFDEWAFLEATLGHGVYSPLEVHNRIHLHAMHTGLPEGSQEHDTDGNTIAHAISPIPASVEQQVVQQDKAVVADVAQAMEPEQLVQRQPFDDWAFLEATLGHGVYSPLEVHNRVHLQMMHAGLRGIGMLSEHKGGGSVLQETSPSNLNNLAAEKVQGKDVPIGPLLAKTDLLPESPAHALHGEQVEDDDMSLRSARSSAPSPKAVAVAPAQGTSEKETAKGQRKSIKSEKRKKREQMRKQRFLKKSGDTTSRMVVSALRKQEGKKKRRARA